ncbi:VWA domain-containing protein [Accumulibacter sp.]|uniref:vWA domain-containing protein n=1 Tax=Accumulibacter sp. TaxID=2053492 RepID=UPI0025ECFB01|nr:VWA domain-containing protein [Accumulibacter sp.]MCM8594083.1 VWA domain-containing protein [Accumulibacter sp.]MCM8624492.1 VWA domain-containing protein [Accumulibacter sp.]MDS4048227.1 VWA domain-containing protein [Accumulibacter sp.]
MPDANTPRILIHPLKPALIAALPQKLPVLVRIQAPDSPSEEKKARQPYCFALVVDRSGSMAGEPLVEAVRCARHIVDRLEPSDTAALVVFDDRVRIVAPAAPVGDRKALHTALATIQPGGSTNLHGGWQAGADALLPDSAGAAIARVILLSDGNANVGALTDSDGIAACCARAAEAGVTTSTYGLGRNFNEDLMVAMAERGGGNHYYGDTAADLFEPFAEEFDFISSLCARHVRLSLAAPQGVTIRLLNDYPVDGDGVMPVVRLPDIAFGAEAWALVELEVPATLARAGAAPLLQAAVTAATPEGLPLAFADATLAVDVVAAAVWETLLEDPLVVARRAEIEAGKLLARARQAAEYGDWGAVEQMLAEARQRFASQPWVIQVLESMVDIARSMDSARFRKEALYTSRKMDGRLSAKAELLGSLAAEAAVPSFVRRKVAQGKAQFRKQPDEPQK